MKFAGMNFIRTDFVSMDGKKIVAFTEDTTSIEPFQLQASREGLKIKGEPTKQLVSETDLQEFAKFLSDAWVEVRKLKPQIATTLAGH